MDVRERAKKGAELAAIEQAVGSFIRSHTIVSNRQVVYDPYYPLLPSHFQGRLLYRVGVADKIGQGLSVKYLDELFLRLFPYRMHRTESVSVALALFYKTDIQEYRPLNSLYGLTKRNGGGRTAKDKAALRPSFRPYKPGP